MYSVFLPFGAVVIDLLLVFVYFKHDQWLEGGTTAVFALFPLFVTAFLLYSKWTELKLVSTKSGLSSHLIIRSTYLLSTLQVTFLLSPSSVAKYHFSKIIQITFIDSTDKV